MKLVDWKKVWSLFDFGLMTSVTLAAFSRRFRAAEDFEIVDELCHADIPIVAQGIVATFVSRTIESSANSQGEVFVETTHRSAPDDVQGPRDRKTGDGSPTGERLEHHEPECVCLARKNENIGGGVGARECLIVQVPKENNIRIVRFQFRENRTVPRDDLGAGQIKIKEGGNILFDGHSTGVK